MSVCVRDEKRKVSYGIYKNNNNNTCKHTHFTPLRVKVLTNYPRVEGMERVNK